MLATLTSKAQITLPKSIRELLELQPGDKVDFTAQPDGRVTVAKMARASPPSFCALRGLLPRPARAYSVEEMMHAVQEAAAARAAPVKRSKR